MQIIALPRFWMIASFIAGWFIIQMGAALLANRIPSRLLQDSGLFRVFKFESDSLYRRVFRVHKWKHLLPDGAAASKNGFRKKHMVGSDPEYIRKFILESKRAELIHWIAIFPFWVFGLWSPPIVIPIMLLYALAANMPCIIAQRYNRPRLRRLLALVEQREKSQHLECIKNRTDVTG